MSAVVDWGHWLVTVLFMAVGVDIVADALVAIPSDLRDDPQDIVVRVLECTVLAACAWGIAKWRRWSRLLAAAICACWLLFMLSVSVVNLPAVILLWREVLPPVLIVCSVLVWLLLPAVRAEYDRRNQPA